MVLKPVTVEEPFSTKAAETFSLEPMVSERGGTFMQTSVKRIDVDGREALLDSGARVGFDAAIACFGARPRIVLGSAITFRPPALDLEIDSLIRQAADHPSRRICFALPAAGSWPLPIYELALLANERIRALLAEVTCTIVTPEARPLAIFGPAASQKVAELLRVRGIEVLTESWPREGPGGIVRLVPGNAVLEAGAILAMPALQGPAPSGLPVDARGFIPIDEHARVDGAARVYAAGDGTNYPVKHGGIGTQQADAAAEHIAALAGADLDPQPFRPVIRGRLIIGDEWLNLAADASGSSSEASPEPLWWPPQKVAGKYLSALITGGSPRDPGELPPEGVEVSVDLPREWHSEPMALDPLNFPDFDREG
jgi:sulfide:quinone oxidoreductase